MSYQENRTIVTMIFGTVLLLAYTLYCSSQELFASSVDSSALARTMLAFIGMGIVLMILLQIFFHVLYSVGLAVSEQIKDPKAESQGLSKAIDRRIKTEFREDERDHLIELKASKVGSIFWGIGFVGALGLLALNFSAAIMLHVLFYACLVGSLGEGLVQLFLYRKAN